jgi:hypothetical protein
MFMVRDPRHVVTASRVWRRQNVVIIVLSIFVILSSLASAYTFAVVYQTRRLLRAQLETAVFQIGQVREQTVNYDFPIQQTFPISTTIQLNESIDVPINTTVPIQQRIVVPVEVPVVGQVDLPVNLDLTVPVSTTVRVAIDRQIPIATDVDLNTNIPLSIDLSQPPLGDVLRDLENALRDVLVQF